MRKILSQNVDTCKSEVGSGRPSVSGKKMPPRPPIMAKPPIVINGIMPPRPITNGAPILPNPDVVLLIPRAVFRIIVGNSSAVYRNIN